MILVRISFTLLYSEVNYVRTLLFCDPPNHLVSQFSACATFPVKIVPMVQQPLMSICKARHRFLCVTIRFVVDMPQLKEDLLPVLIVSLFIQVFIQICKQRWWIKGLNFRKQTFVNLFQQSLLIPEFKHLAQHSIFYQRLQIRTITPAIAALSSIQFHFAAFFSAFSGLHYHPDISATLLHHGTFPDILLLGQADTS